MSVTNEFEYKHEWGIEKCSETRKMKNHLRYTYFQSIDLELETDSSLFVQNIYTSYNNPPPQPIT